MTEPEELPDRMTMADGRPIHQHQWNVPPVPAALEDGDYRWSCHCGTRQAAQHWSALGDLLALGPGYEWEVGFGVGFDVYIRRIDGTGSWMSEVHIVYETVQDAVRAALNRMREPLDDSLVNVRIAH